MVRFYLSELRPGAQSARFVVTSLGRITPRLMVYDLSGRRLRTLSDGVAVQGRQEFVWDFRDTQGESVPTGMYFARLSDAGSAQTVRFPVVR